MQPLRVLAVVSLVACGDDGRRPLFDGDSLAGWYSWLPSQGRDRDPHQIFAVHDGMLHILGTDVAPADFEFGYLATTEEYADFRLRFEYQWGPRKYVDFPRDSGVFIAMVGPDALWPRSLECQVMENDTGSAYIFDHATVATEIDPAQPDNPTYRAGGLPYTTPRRLEPYPRVGHGARVDMIDGWNAVEIVADGDTAQFIVNGTTTFRSTRHLQPDPAFPDDPARDVPLASGRIVIQQEGAEVFYRNVTIEPL